MSLKLKGNGTINHTVQLVDDLANISNPEVDDICIVTDENRGGTFIYRGTGTDNSGTIFSGWHRQYDGAVNVKWFDDEVREDAEVIQSALGTGAKEVIGDNTATYTINESIIIPTEVALRANIVIGTAGIDAILVNDKSSFYGSIVGTGTTGIVERGIYPATDGVKDVVIDADISNITVGVHAQLVGGLTIPSNWKVNGKIHNIVGTIGDSEGYGVLFSPANNCKVYASFEDIERHAVYLSAGASFNDVNISVDNCRNIAVNVFSASSQPSSRFNNIVVKTKNLSDNTGVSGAVGLIQKVDFNNVTVFFTQGASNTKTAVWIEGAEGGDYPIANKIKDSFIFGTFDFAPIRVLNADSTQVTGNIIEGNWVSSAIQLTKTGNTTVSSGGYIEGNTIRGSGGTAPAITNSYEDTYTVGQNSIHNISGLDFRDFSTNQLRQGRLKKASGKVLTDSIPPGSFGTVNVTLPFSIKNLTSAFVSATSGGGSNSDYVTANEITCFVTSANTIQIRHSNNSATAQTFNIYWAVEAD